MESAVNDELDHFGDSAEMVGREMMKALTLWPEWAYAILKLGKRVENRGWLPPRGLTDFAIHAGKQIGGNGRDPNGDIGVML